MFDRGNRASIVLPRHSRHCLSGIHLGFVSDGSPLTTGGDDEDNDGSPLTNCGDDEDNDGSPLTTGGDDEDKDGSPLTTGGMTEITMDPR